MKMKFHKDNLHKKTIRQMMDGLIIKGLNWFCVKMMFPEMPLFKK